MGKVILKDFRKTNVVSLPSVPGAEVEIYTSLLVGDVSELSEKYPNMSDLKHPDAQKSGFEILSKCIKSWNFTDESGNDLNVSVEVIKQLPLEDVQLLQEQIKVNDKKKI